MVRETVPVLAGLLLLLLASNAGAQVGFTFQNVIGSSPDLAAYAGSAGDGHGPGGVFTDLDNDGYTDLFLVTKEGEPTFVFRNELNGATGGRRFVKIQEFPGEAYGSTGAVAGDYDNDGDLDVYVINHPFSVLGSGISVAPNVLYQNQWVETGNLSFVDVTASTDPTPTVANDDQMGLANARWEGLSLDNSLSACWGDVDRDGDLDLFVGNHDGTWAAPHEAAVPGQRDILYRNEGDGTFTDISMLFGVTGFETDTGAYCSGGQCFSSANASMFADLDNDGWLDLIVINKANNHLVDADMVYRNLGSAGGVWQGFEVVTWDLTFPFGRISHNGMGLDAGDYDNDGDLDIYITDLECLQDSGCSSVPPNDFFVNLFSDSGGTLDFMEDSADVAADFSWGAQWFDANNDGRLDLHVTTGISGGGEYLPGVPGGDAGFEDYFYLWDVAAGRFIDRTVELGANQCVNNDPEQCTAAHGNMAGDFDRDGAIDMFVINTKPDGTPSVLWQNQLSAGTAGKRFLNLTLRSHPRLAAAPYKSGRDAIGARVEVSANVGLGGTTKQIREVVSGASNAATTAALELEFGMGTATTGNVTIDWPSGRQTVLNNVATNRFLTISEPGSGGSQIIGEMGRRTVNHNSTTVGLNGTYTNPVVIAQPPSFNGADASVMRITSVQPSSFTFFLDEAPHHDGPHASETVSYVVLEAGSWTLPDGSRLEVGTVNTSATVGKGVANQWQTVNLPNALSASALFPVVLTQVQTHNDTSWVKTRQRNADRDSFQVALEQEDTKTVGHGQETIGWVAMEPARGLWTESFYAAGNTRNIVTQNWHRVDFGQDIGTNGAFLAAMATYDGADGSQVRYQNLGADRVEVKIEEETTADAEVNHTTEVVSFMAISEGKFLRADAFAPDPPPVASFTSSCFGLSCSLSAAGSTDNDPIPAGGYTWVFDDGAAEDGISTSHVFRVGGSRPVTLRITDQDGQTSSVTQNVVINLGNNPPVPSFTVSCSVLRCTFNANASSDDGFITSYAWNFGNGGSASGSFVIHDFDRPGTHTITLTVTDNSGQNVSLTKTAQTSVDVGFVASFVPQFGQPRTSVRASPSAPLQPIDFFYDPNLGNFEARPGGPPACAVTPENPTYLKVSLDSDHPIDGCNFKFSIQPESDPVTVCDSGLVALLNSGGEVILGTDEYHTDAATCVHQQPLAQHIPFDQSVDLLITLRVNGLPYRRLIRYTKTSETLIVDALQDTYVSQMHPTTPFGNSTQMQVQGGPTAIKFSFLKFSVPNLQGGTLASVQLQAEPQVGSNLTKINLHDVCLDTWSENSLTWNNWGTQAQDCGATVLGADVPTAPVWLKLPVSSIGGAGLHSLGLAPGEDNNVLHLQTSESADKPRLLVTVQR
ncbi:MAG: PKD domain-containing protein [Acidobacteriota bacterium]